MKLGDFANPGLIALVAAGFARRGNVLGTGALQDFLGFLRPLRSVRMNGKQNSPIFNAAFVSLGFVLRDSTPEKSPRAAPACAPDSASCQGRHNRSGRYKRPQSGNGKCS